jgi:hypothetical protein
MLNIAFSYGYAECDYAECRYAECLGTRKDAIFTFCLKACIYKNVPF